MGPSFYFVYKCEKVQITILDIFVLCLLNLFCVVFYVSVQIWVLVLYFYIDLLYFLKYPSEYFLFHLPYTRLTESVSWMKHVLLMKVRWFHMPRLNTSSNILFGVLFSEHRCRATSMNALDATSVAGTRVRLRRT